MISGTPDRRWRRLAWSAFAALILNVAILTAVLHIAPKLWGAKRGEERVQSTTFLSLQKRQQPTPQPQTPVPQQKPKPVVAQIRPYAGTRRVTNSTATTKTHRRSRRRRRIKPRCSRASIPTCADLRIPSPN